MRKSRAARPWESGGEPPPGRRAAPGPARAMSAGCPGRSAARPGSWTCRPRSARQAPSAGRAGRRTRRSTGSRCGRASGAWPHTAPAGDRTCGTATRRTTGNQPLRHHGGCAAATSPHSLIRHRSCTHHPSPAGAPPYGIGPPLAQSMIRSRARHTTEAVSALSAATPPQYWTSFPVGAAACRVGSAWCRTAPGPSPVPLRRFSATSTGTASSPPSRNPLRMLHIVTLTARRSTRRARRSCRSGVITLLGAWVSDGALGRGGAWWRSGFRPWWAGRWRR